MKLILPLLLSCLIVSQSFSAEQPNVILFMADDMGMGDTSAYQNLTGNSNEDQISTPQMERLARLGVLFSDAHTPSSRCTATRYGLLTGRYAFRSRLKHFVLFGSQGDPLIETDRPTLATLFKSAGYSTGIVGKWHVGLRYTRPDGSPAAAWEDADLTKPLTDCPTDHGFDFARYTSRSHGTSGPDPTRAKRAKANSPTQNVGPGHLHGRNAVSATGNGKQLQKDGPNAYILTKLGSRHSDHAVEFLNNHLSGKQSKDSPFFLYYPSNSNHGPYTPDKSITGIPVAGAAKSKAGKAMGVRYDYIYENDVALGRLITYLQTKDDPRRPGNKLIDNTIVIFTSDNGAEIPTKTATGPVRSNKGSAYEGGHRVPFIISWPAGGVGDGNPQTPGKVSTELIALQDLYATFSSILGKCLPNPENGEKGAEDSFNILPALQGGQLPPRPLFHNDHKEFKKDPAAMALRLDNPEINGKVWIGKWKLFFDGELARYGKANSYELYNLATDPKEAQDISPEKKYEPLLRHLHEVALLHRNIGGHRLASLAKQDAVAFDWRSPPHKSPSLQTKLVASGGKLIETPEGLGIQGNQSPKVNGGEAIEITFRQDVLLESIAIQAGKDGSCGGFVKVGSNAPLAIYCVDADNDSREQHSNLSDLGVLEAGQILRLDSSPHYGSEPPGRWLLQTLVVRPL